MWILIIFLVQGGSGGGRAIHSVQFNTKTACEAALAALPRTGGDSFTRIAGTGTYAVCVDKGGK